MRWNVVGGGMFCPVAVSPRPGQVVLFARAPNGELLHREWSSGGWSDVRSLGEPIARTEGGHQVPADWQLAACSGDPARIDLFARSPDGDLLHMAAAGAKFEPFAFLGAPATTNGDVTIPLGLIAPPAACARAGRMDVFALGQTGEILHTWLEGSEWSGFDSLGVPAVRGEKHASIPVASALSVCRSGPEQIALFVRGSRGDLMLKWWDGSRWSDFESLGWPQEEAEMYPAVTVPSPLTGPPAVCSWGRNRLDVFARGGRGQILHKSWDGRAWSPFVSLGMPVDSERRLLPSTGAVTASTWGPTRLDVFTRAVDGNVYHACFDGKWDH
jgi:hypothetical protein